MTSSSVPAMVPTTRIDGRFDVQVIDTEEEIQEEEEEEEEKKYFFFFPPLPLLR
jgi:hypothetical protein